MDLYWAYDDGNYGIPEKCFCGRQMKLVASTGEETPGRKYYLCPEWCKEGNGAHIWKWWDEGVTRDNLHCPERARREKGRRC